MDLTAEPHRAKLLHLVRFGGLAAIALLVLTACYTDVAVQPTATAVALSAVTNVPPTQPPKQNPPPTKAGGNEQPPPNGGGGGDGGGGGGGGGGASPVAASATATGTRTTLRASPIATVARTTVAPPTGSKTPVRPGTTVPPLRTVPPAGTVAAASTGTVRTTGGVTPPTGGTKPSGVTPPAGGTTTSGVTPPAGVTVSPTRRTTETTGSPSATGMLVITKHENFENAILPGACFALLNGETTVASACDQGDGDGNADAGVIAIAAPPGAYTLHETTPPPGYNPAEDTPVELVAGTPTTIDVIDHLIATTAASPSVTTGEGVLIASLVGEDGTPFGGVCLSLTGPGTYQVCDDGDGDADPTTGTIEIDAMTAGDYVLTVTPPAGYELAGAPPPVTIPAAAFAQITLTFRATGTPTGATPSPVGYVIAAVTGEDGTTPVGGACLHLTGPASYDVCDDQEGDQDSTPGTIEIDGVAAGDYAVDIQPPSGYEPAAELPTTVHVDPEQFAQLTFSFRLTATTGTVEIDKVDAADGVTPLSGACFDLTGDGGTYQVCDDAENDADELVGPDAAPGVIVIADVVAGDYTIHETQAPEGHAAGPDQTVHVEAGQIAKASVPNGTPTPPETGTLNVRAVDPDGNPAPGACYATTMPDGTPRQSCDDDGDGVVTFDGLPAGDYTVTETTIPAGFQAADVTEQTVTVPAGQTVEISFTVQQAQPTTGTIVITKVDAVEGTPTLGGACFTVTGADGNPVEQCDDDGDGTIRFENLAPGDYTVHESRAPENYLAAEDQTATVTAGAETALTFVDQAAPQTGTLVVTKVDAADGTTPLGGACFTATGADGTPVELCDDDGDGVTRFDGLAPGDYTVTETRAPDGYTAAEAQTATVTAGAETALTFADQAAPQTGTLVVTKVDAADGTTTLGGACFAVTGVEATPTEGTPGEQCDDDGDGIVRFENLAPGDYTVSETRAPDGYTAAEAQTATVTAGNETALTFTDQAAPQTGSLTVVTLNSDGAALPGACYTATGPDSASVQGCDDDGDGTVPLGDVAAGDWQVEQTTPPPGYDIAEPSTQSVTVAAGQPAQVSFTNQPTAPTTGSLAISIQDDQGQPVSGACFDLAGPQEVHACDDADNDADPTPGQILVQNLAPGDYTVTESQVPDGYQGADPQTVTVAAGAEPAPLAFVNAKAPTGVPLPSPVVYTDDAGRLWLLRPNDTQPTRLDADDRPFDPSMDPVFSSDRTWVAFLVHDPNAPAANMVWVKLDDLTFGGVDFSGVGTPRRLAWLPGHTDTLIVAADLPGGGVNVFFYRTDTSELPVTLFAADQQPAAVDAIVPAPTGALVAIQATGADGDPDTYIVDTADPANPVLTQVGPNSGADPDAFVAWSPAGDRLVMQSGSDTPLLYLADAGGNATPLGDASLFLGDPHAGTAPQWSPDAGWVAAFDGDPAAGGQLRLFDGGGTAHCDPIASVIAFDWSPTDNRIWALVAPPNEPVRLVAIGTDCAQQEVTTFDTGIDTLLWAPNGGALALVDHGDAGATVVLLVGDQLVPIDPAPAGVAITDVLSWSPGGELLALYAGGPTASLWVVSPGAATPAAVNGSTLPEGATYVTRVWWA